MKTLFGMSPTKDFATSTNRLVSGPARTRINSARSHRSRFRIGLAVATAIIISTLFAGCSSESPALTTATPSELTTQTPTPTPDSFGEGPSGPSDSPVATSRSGGVVLAIGVVLPNPGRTPGATNPAVTQTTINQTICVVGWTSTVRPPSSVTTALKIKQLASGYDFQGDMSTKDYEEDHLISLELGGSPSAEANLWPEPYASPDGARVKDQLENKLHALVCSGAMTLTVAQTAIATNWWSAYGAYVGEAVAPVAPVPVAPVPVPVPVPVMPSGATALCRDGTYSYAAHHQGACSGHGGVAQFYK